MSAEALVTDLGSLPDGIQTAVRNNGGGFVNHNLFWTVIAPGGNSEDMASDALKSAVDAAFGNYETFKAQFSAAAATRFGSGWATGVADAPSTTRATTTPTLRDRITTLLLSAILRRLIMAAPGTLVNWVLAWLRPGT